MILQEQVKMFTTFLLRVAMLAHYMLSALSVHPLVCPSVTIQHCTKIA